MNPEEIVDDLTNLDLMMGGISYHGNHTMHGGACARDLQESSGIGYRSPISRAVIGTVRFDRVTGEVIREKPTVIDLGYEQYVTGVDNEMLVLSRKQPIPLSCYVKRGYDFQI
ncbi:MAG: hypothetical protein AABX11_04335 [Nanoarchaeota archaeon]